MERIYTEQVFHGHGSTSLVPDKPREEIVRCRDCAFYCSEPPLPGCTQFDFSRSEDMSNGFCAWGVKRDD